MSRVRLFLNVGMLAGFLALAGQARGGTFSFQSVGLLSPNGWSTAEAVSADGQVVVGGAEGRAYRWTKAGGMVPLATLAGHSMQATAVSADGSVVAGAGTASSVPDTQAVRWTSDGAVHSLGALPNNSQFSRATGISGDGSIIIGISGGRAPSFRWTSGTGMTSALVSGNAWAISEDGSTIVSSLSNGSIITGYSVGQNHGVSITDFPGGNNAIVPTGVSADGKWAVGWGSKPDNMREAFLWSADTGTIGLGYLSAESPGTGATAVSTNGSVVVGGARYQGYNEAFVWTAETGMLRLRSFLYENGVTAVAGWTLGPAESISRDGRTIVGTGTYGGRTYGWVATIPEPSSYLLGLLASIAFALVATRRQVCSCERTA